MKKSQKLLLMVLTLVIIIAPNLKAYADDELEVDAKAAIIVERNSGKVIYEKNSDIKNYPASVTKILTAIIVLENCNLDDIATVSQTAISQIPSEYVVAPLKVGEELRVEDLLYALMLKSANDAAYVLAEHVGGSVEGFADIMNTKAEEIGCKESHFVNPNGLHNENHYVTAYDMYLISDYAMKNETFAKIVSTYQYTLPATNKYNGTDRIMVNTNNLINSSSDYYNESVKGIKTGTTIPAGNCLIADAEKDGLEFLTVVLGAETSNSKFVETNKMLDYSFENYLLTNIHEKGDIIKSIEVEKATEETKNLNLVISDGIKVMKNKGIDVDDIKPEIIISENVVAPISEGQELGTVRYSVDGLEYSAKLLAANSVERKIYNKEIMIAVGCFLVIIILVRVVGRKK
ncbi:MAG: D-alanyl-D-alanine carboxypeptidase [Clostridia bacterium]|nr:D-alanyl-D-alanine carboxypeptidase [Clostridia bacterium]